MKIRIIFIQMVTNNVLVYLPIEMGEEDKGSTFLLSLPVQETHP